MGPRTIRRPPQQRDHSTDRVRRIDNLKIWLKEVSASAYRRRRDRARGRMPSAVPRAYANRWLERQFGRGREWGGVLIGLGGMPKPTAADARAILIMAAQAPGSVADQRPQLPAEMLAIPLTSAELFYGLYTLLLLYCPPAIVVGPGGP